LVSVCTIALPEELEGPLTLELALTVQLKTVPLTNEVNAIFVAVLEQMVCALGVATAFVLGLTVMKYVVDVPAQVAVPVVLAVTI
jgi:hypothetical protein